MYLLNRRNILMAAALEDNTDYTLLPLTFKCITGGNLSIKNENSSYDRNFEYSLNGGAWTAFSLPKSSGTLLITALSPGDTISFRRDNDNFYQARFVSDNDLSFDIYGNLLSLQYGSAFNGQTTLQNTSKQAFGGVFNATNVVDASNLMLTAPTLSNGCYQLMFANCKSLVKAPKLPATTLGNNCYREMFYDCNSLIYGPTELPATTLKTGCYYSMFSQCYALTSVPAELPAKTMVNDCYYAMFNYCTNLVTPPRISATTLASQCFMMMFQGNHKMLVPPELPATTLATKCYWKMFADCPLITSIRLPAATLANACYQNMFKDCTSLNHIECLATNISASNCINGWVNNVAATGTFVKAASMSSWPTGTSGIPSGWTVTDAS